MSVITTIKYRIGELSEEEYRVKNSEWRKIIRNEALKEVNESPYINELSLYGFWYYDKGLILELEFNNNFINDDCIGDQMVAISEGWA